MCRPPAFGDTRPRHGMDQPKWEGVCVRGGHENKCPALGRSLMLGRATFPGTGVCHRRYHRHCGADIEANSQTVTTVAKCGIREYFRVMSAALS
jgi:hypothetical protein